MNQIYLISLKTLKSNYGFDENIQDSYVLPLIKKGQDIIIRPLLGEKKLNELYTQVESSTVTNENDKLIKVYIEPILAYYVKSELMFETVYKMKNKADDSGIDFDELVRISKKYRTDCDNYQIILKDYLCINNIVLPADNTKEEQVYQTGIYLGNSVKRNYWG